MTDQSTRVTWDVPVWNPRLPGKIPDHLVLAEPTTSAQELYDQVLALYPDRLNPGALWLSSRALKPSSS